MGKNLETTAAIYAAFGTGDIAFIMDQIAEDVRWEDWEDNYGQKGGLVAMVPRNGKDAVLGFFEVAAGLGIKDFRVLSLMEGENQIAAEIYIVTDTYRDEEIHLWTFNEAGKIVRLRHYVDTAKHLALANSQKAAGLAATSR